MSVFRDLSLARPKSRTPDASSKPVGWFHLFLSFYWRSRSSCAGKCISAGFAVLDWVTGGQRLKSPPIRTGCVRESIQVIYASFLQVLQCGLCFDWRPGSAVVTSPARVAVQPLASALRCISSGNITLMPAIQLVAAKYSVCSTATKTCLILLVVFFHVAIFIVTTNRNELISKYIAVRNHLYCLT